MTRSRLVELAGQHRVLLSNFSYLGLLEVVCLLVPLAIYPYLTRVLGKEVYGLVVTAQMVSGYASIFVDFGFRSVAARYIAIHRDSPRLMSQIVSAIMGWRTLLWGGSLAVYLLVVWLVPTYRAHWVLFLSAYTLTFNELLFPQFFFQGIEKMRYISLLNIALRLLSLVLVLTLIQTPHDYHYVPLFMGAGYLLAGVASFVIMHRREQVHLCWPRRMYMRYVLHDALPLFGTNVVCSIKDKFSYLLIASWVSMGSVLVYDLGARFLALLAKPSAVIGMVLFPRLASTKSLRLFRQGRRVIFWSTLLLTLGVACLLPWLVPLFLPGVTDYWPLRIFLIAAPVLAVSTYVASEFLVAFNFGHYMFRSILVTTVGYLVGLGLIVLLGLEHAVMPFVVLGVFSYSVELVYRVWVYRRKRRAFRVPE